MAKEISRAVIDGISARMAEFFLILKQGNLALKSQRVEAKRAEFGIAPAAVLDIAMADIPDDQKIARLTPLFRGDAQLAQECVEIIATQKMALEYALALGGDFTGEDALQRDLLFRRARKEFVTHLSHVTGLGEKQISDGILRDFEDAVKGVVAQITGESQGK